jgi:hypothetical protein
MRAGGELAVKSGPGAMANDSNGEDLGQGRQVRFSNGNWCE